MEMAVGFKLSNVLEIEIDKEEENALAIIFTTKAIRYKIIFDDAKKRKQIAEMILAYIPPKPKAPPEKPKKTFYLEESKMDKRAEP